MRKLTLTVILLFIALLVSCDKCSKNTLETDNENRVTPSNNEVREWLEHTRERLRSEQ